MTVEGEASVEKLNYMRGESSRRSKPASFKKRRVRHPQKIGVYFGDVEGSATRPWSPIGYQVYSEEGADNVI